MDSYYKPLLMELCNYSDDKELQSCSGLLIFVRALSQILPNILCIYTCESDRNAKRSKTKPCSKVLPLGISSLC